MTVLARVSPRDVLGVPYPHIVIEDAIDPSLCATLIREFPPLDLVVGPRASEDNVKGNLTADRALRDARVSATWQAFLRAHLTADFFWSLESLFHEHLLAAFPAMAPWLSPGAARIGVLRNDSPDRCDVMLDAIIGAHSPVRGASRIERRPHVKGRNRLIVGFLYLKAEDDTATGGDFEFYASRGHAPPRFGTWRQARVDDVARVKTVPYRNNTLVITMNSPQAIQAVSGRGPGSRPLMYMHFLAQTRRTLFDLDYTVSGRLHECVWRRLDPYK